MIPIHYIYNLLDWNNSVENQNLGIELAGKMDNLSYLLQPCFEKYNKNVWENCAIVLEKKEDYVLTPHLGKLLEWIQDLNWPGAIRIFNRLQKFKIQPILNKTIVHCIVQAKAVQNEVWEQNLLYILHAAHRTDLEH